MSSTMLSSAEVVAGLCLLALALILYRGLVRMGQRPVVAAPRGFSIKSEMFVVGWMGLVVLACALVAFPLA